MRILFQYRIPKMQCAILCGTYVYHFKLFNSEQIIPRQKCRSRVMQQSIFLTRQMYSSEELAVGEFLQTLKPSQYPNHFPFPLNPLKYCRFRSFLISDHIFSKLLHFLVHRFYYISDRILTFSESRNKNLFSNFPCTSSKAVTAK